MERKAESFDYSANAYMSDNSRIPRRVAIAQSSSVLRCCRRRLLKLAFYCFAVCLLVVLYKYFVVGASAEEQSGGGEKRYLQIGVEKQPEECRVKSKKRGINFAGEEPVSACAVAWSGAGSDVRLRYNTGRSNGPALDDAALVPQVVQMLEAGVTGEYVVCRFRQVAKPPTAVDAAFVAQLDRQQILLLASGGAVQDGILMILGWMVLLPNGILFARYFEAMWPQHKPFGLFIWFHLHRSLNALGVLLVVVAAALIWIAQEWNWVGPQFNGTDWTIGQWHSLLGSLGVVLGLAQPFIALCRCHPGTPNRPIFNWIHRIIGLGAFAISASVIFLSTWIGGAPWPAESRGWARGLVIFYWAVLLCVAIGLETLLALAERAAAATATSSLCLVTITDGSYCCEVEIPDRQLEPQSEDACPKWGCVRVALLSVFLTLAVGVFIALALLLAID